MKKTQNEVTVGAFVIVGFILLSLIVFFVSGVYLFRAGYQVDVDYDYVSILDKGAPVRMAGVRIGEVSTVTLRFDENLERAQVRVKLFIEKGIQIRENYSFEIRGTHILSEPHIEISPRAGGGRILQEGDVIKGADPVPVEALIDRANLIASHLEGILGDFKGALQDKEVAAGLKSIVINLADVTGSLQTILSGSDEELKETITNIQGSTESIQKILDHIEKGEGTAGGLLMKDELYEELRAFVKEIRARPWRLMKKDDGKKLLFF